ncbi:nuclear transport factor 2 family protein [Noviherbaspirillum sp.]|uniref:nuclear transport factor 2 family protein n=1 Tax=Noviherbaspirillum sp. TaxID=1926288 RepID=UPI002FE1D6AE
MRQLELCKRYLAVLGKGELEKVLPLFEAGAVVVSPLYGTLDAQSYHQRFFADTDISRALGRLINVFHAMNDERHIALHFHYTWVRKDGRTISFECVNVYELTADHGKFTRITSIYDTGLLRRKE